MLPDFEQKEEAISLFRRLMELSINQNRYVRCICLEDTPIGFINDVEIKASSIELGYVIHPDSQGRGHMTNALRAAIAELKSSGYHNIICGAFETNAASIRVMEKCGMVRLAFTDSLEYRGRVHKCIYYATENEDQSC
jgi:RimJ/RimL family protein N-acetyltransferase